MEPCAIETLRMMVRERLFDVGKSKPLWTDAQIDRALNEAESEASVRARLLRDEVTPSITTVTAAADSSVVTLHRSIFEVERVYRSSDGRDLEPTNVERLSHHDSGWRTRTAQLPEAYVVQTRPDERLQLLLAPIPLQAAELRLVVYRYPRFAMESDGDTPEIAPVHHDGLVSWACHRCLMNRDPDQYERAQADRFLQEFEARFGPRPNADQLRKRREPRERTAIARSF